MNKQIKFLSILGIISVIGGVSTFTILSTSCGGGKTYINNFNLFDDISVKNTNEAEKAMERVTWIWEHCSEYGYSDYGLWSTCRFIDDEGEALENDAFKDSSIFRIGGNGAYADSLKNEFHIYLDSKGIIYGYKEVSIWCELVYDLSWQYCNSINFRISSFQLKGFQNPNEWCDVDGYGIGGKAWIETKYASGAESGLVSDNFGELMDIQYVNGYFRDMDLSDDGSEVFDKSFTCSWGVDLSLQTASTAMVPSFSTRLFGIGETGSVTYDDIDNVIKLIDSPTLYWFNTSFILQNCITSNTI